MRFKYKYNLFYEDEDEILNARKTDRAYCYCGAFQFSKFFLNTLVHNDHLCCSKSYLILHNEADVACYVGHLCIAESCKGTSEETFSPAWPLRQHFIPPAVIFSRQLLNFSE